MLVLLFLKIKHNWVDRFRLESKIHAIYLLLVSFTLAELRLRSLVHSSYGKYGTTDDLLTNIFPTKLTTALN